MRRLQQDPAQHHPPAEQKLASPPHQFYEVNYGGWSVEFPNQIRPLLLSSFSRTGTRRETSKQLTSCRITAEMSSTAASPTPITHADAGFTAEGICRKAGWMKFLSQLSSISRAATSALFLLSPPALNQIDERASPRPLYQ